MTTCVTLHLSLATALQWLLSPNCGIVLLKCSFHFIVRELHREFLRAGSDVMQTFTFYASDDKLGNRGNTAVEIGVSFSFEGPE